ncbi:MAG: hypothetical protein AAF483_08825 [Planctomycetota bacterium]
MIYRSFIWLSGAAGSLRFLKVDLLIFGSVDFTQRDAGGDAAKQQLQDESKIGIQGRRVLLKRFPWETVPFAVSLSMDHTRRPKAGTEFATHPGIG